MAGLKRQFAPGGAITVSYPGEREEDEKRTPILNISDRGTMLMTNGKDREDEESLFRSIGKQVPIRF